MVAFRGDRPVPGRAFTLPPRKAIPHPCQCGVPMSLVVLCNGCLAPFDAERFAGLLRCPACAERAALRLPGSSFGRVVVL